MPVGSLQAFLTIDLHCGSGFYLQVLDFVGLQGIVLFMMADQGEILHHVCCNKL